MAALITGFGGRLPLPGDFNEDSTVDAANYTVWRDAVGSPEGALANDFRGGIICEDQYRQWRDNFGSSLPDVSQAVPEPGAALLAMIAVSTCAVRLCHE